MRSARCALAVCAVASPALADRGARAADGEPAMRLAFLDRLRSAVRPSGGCADPGSFGDPDVRRNAAVIAAAGLCVSESTLAEGVRWRFVSVTNPARPRGPVWYLPHDNENTAFDAAVYAVARYGGRAVALEAGERRAAGGIDPNRIFALSAADARPCRLRSPTPRYTRFVQDLFRGQRQILTIHNNTRRGDVQVDMRGAKTQGFRASGPLAADPDHFVFIAGTEALERDGQARAQRDRLLAAGLNVVHERVSRENSDCSLSNFVALHDRRPYYNVEALHGSGLQTRMVDALMAALGVRPGS